MLKRAIKAIDPKAFVVIYGMSSKFSGKDSGRGRDKDSGMEPARMGNPDLSRTIVSAIRVFAILLVHCLASILRQSHVELLRTRTADTARLAQPRLTGMGHAKEPFVPRL